jgi:hypothetical protein
MSRSWKGVALLATWLVLSGAALAQQYTPTPVGAARIVEPLGCPSGEPPPPPLVPGPITPQMAPPGPPDCLSLPAGHSSAFQCENYTTENCWYSAAGLKGLQRQRMGAGAVSVIDGQSLDTGVAVATAPQIVALRYNDIIPDMAFGVQGTLGYLFNNEAIELSGFVIPSNRKSRFIQFPGRIDAFFHNPPLGFEGDNGLWLQADRMQMDLTSAIAGAELNYRRWDLSVIDCELLLGLRYLNFRDKLSIFTDDDAVSFPQANGLPDPTRQATYLTQTTNNIIAPQIGVEYAAPMPLPILRWIWFGGTAKAAVGMNAVNIQTSLVRGDGFLGFATHSNHITVGQVYELGGYFDFHLLERMRIRAGYNAMWLAGVATSNDQVDFNLANPTGTQNRHGSVLYHGPQIELQLLY